MAGYFVSMAGYFVTVYRSFAASPILFSRKIAFSSISSAFAKLMTFALLSASTHVKKECILVFNFEHFNVSYSINVWKPSHFSLLNLCAWIASCTCTWTRNDTYANKGQDLRDSHHIHNHTIQLNELQFISFFVPKYSLCVDPFAFTVFPEQISICPPNES